MILKPLRPLKIEQISPTELAIDWADGHRSLHSFRLLRLACRCAVCKDEMTGKIMLEPEKIPADIHAKQILPVGGYAICIHWSDGHQTGIYPFDFLRKACECAECASFKNSKKKSSAD